MNGARLKSSMAGNDAKVNNSLLNSYPDRDYPK